MANAGYGIGYEDLSIHHMYTKDNHMSSFMRGELKSGLNTGQRQRALRRASESAGLPTCGVEPHSTSARCLVCGGNLKFVGKKHVLILGHAKRMHVRNMYCKPCGTIRDRDANARANILFRTILEIITNHTGDTGKRIVTLHAIILK